MKKISMLGVAVALMCWANLAHAADMPAMPKPSKEHKWLNKFLGTWTYNMSMYMEPGKPPMKAKGTETFTSLGGFWAVGQGKGEMMGNKFSSLFTVGYDTHKKKYVGTWVDDSGMSGVWNYEGSVTGTTLTLFTKGPCPMKGNAMTDFKETTEFKGKNQKIFKSYMKDNGKWVLMMVIDSRKK